jgi:FtsP/CotA-like multicopper oxidase with cupredoxin domain
VYIAKNSSGPFQACGMKQSGLAEGGTMAQCRSRHINSRTLGIMLAALFFNMWFAPTSFAEMLPPVSINDNRIPAGTLHDGVLELHLEMREGIWHPLEENGDAIQIFAFAETGKPLSVPAPLIRVPEGTRIEITLKSMITVPATVHGFHERPGSATDVVIIQPGETKHVSFRAGKRGTYSYWVGAPVDGAPVRRLMDSQLAGAFIVDAPGEKAADRIFILTRWNGPLRTMINGKSWPFTERFTFQTGEHVHWRWINASDVNHPMHLHGSYFLLDGEGDGEIFAQYEDDHRKREFTQLIEVDATYNMTWIPETPGRWTYHCHKLVHMRLPLLIEGGDVGGTPISMEDHSKAHDENYAGMGGMILGITVVDPANKARNKPWKPERKLELKVAERKEQPELYELTLNEQVVSQGAPAGPAGVTPLVGPPIVLRQHQPVEITVKNDSRHATAIHWHGMEIESYYDGVPTWGGIGDQKSPAIEPGQSFVVHMTPPTAGTFIYHTHYHDENQLTNGIVGPLVVLPEGGQYEPETDKTFLFALGPTNPYGPVVLLNGLPQPTAMQLKTRTVYRFRLINISPAFGSLHVALKNGGALISWRVIKKDGADLPAAYNQLQPADQLVSVGETYDVEFESNDPQQIILEGSNPDGRRASQVLNFQAK